MDAVYASGYEMQRIIVQFVDHCQSTFHSAYPILCKTYLTAFGRSVGWLNVQKLMEKNVSQNYQKPDFKLLLKDLEKGIRIGYRTSIGALFCDARS